MKTPKKTQPFALPFLRIEHCRDSAAIDKIFRLGVCLSTENSPTKIETACANTVLDAFAKDDDYISHMKLQKILYFSAGYCLARNNLYIAEHNFQAWPYGPVLPKLYSVLKSNGDSPINLLIKHQGEKYLYTEGETFECITHCVNKFKGFTAWELSEISHAKEGPWFKTVEEKGYKQDIDLEFMRDYFQSHMELF